MEHPASDNDSGDEHDDSSSDDSYGPDGFVDEHGLELIQDADFPSYFTRRDNRLFHSHGNYPLPVDGHELRRMTVDHRIFRRALGSHYFGPLKEFLKHDPDHPKSVLDIGTGNGLWPQVMAEEFPHVQFDAIDKVPIATRLPHSNVNFVVQDMRNGLDLNRGKYDVIHARTIAFAVEDWPRLLQEVARALVPGGLFLSGEWGALPVMEDPNLDPPTNLPACYRFFNRIETIRPTAYQRAAEQLPVGPWPQDPAQQEIGRELHESFLSFGDSLRVASRDAGISDDEYTALTDNAYTEFGTVPGCCMPYITVHARRVEV